MTSLQSLSGDFAADMIWLNRAKSKAPVGSAAYRHISQEIAAAITTSIATLLPGRGNVLKLIDYRN